MISKHKRNVALCQTEMDVSRSTVLCRIELTSDGKAPKSVVLFPRPAADGVIVARDGRKFGLYDAAALVAAFAEYGQDLPFDIEHASELKAPMGEPAPAQGWITGLAVNADGSVSASVDWTDEGAALIELKKYRYVSPAFKLDRSIDPPAITTVVSAGLTNRPALKLPALASTQGASMNPKIIKMLGLKDNCTQAEYDAALEAHLAKVDAEKKSATDALVAAEAAHTKTKADLAAAQAAKPELANFVPRADLDAVRAELTALKTAADAEKKDAFAAKVKETVEKASSDGKIPAASVAYHIGACTSAEALEAFKKYVEGAPVIAAPSNPGAPPKPVVTAETCSDEQVAIWAKLGLTKEQGLAAAKL